MLRPRFPKPIIEEKYGQAPGPPDVACPQVQVWQDQDGEILARCCVVDGQHWIDLPRVASFSFVSGAETVMAIPHRSARSEIILDAYWRTVLPLLQQSLGQEALHASAILTPHGVAAFCAANGTGKSTLAYALSRRGYSLWADDAVAFEIAPGCPRAFPLPFQLHLRPPSTSLFGQDGAAPPPSPGWDGADEVRMEPAPLHLLFVLERSAGAGDGREVEAVRLSPSQALVALLPHAYCFSLQDGGRKWRMLQHYLDLVARVPVYAVRFQPGLEKLPAIMDRIEQLIGDFGFRNSDFEF